MGFTVECLREAKIPLLLVTDLREHSAYKQHISKQRYKVLYMFVPG